MTYLGYPFMIYIISILKKKKHVIKEYYPSVSILVAAYNEEKVIEEKIRNLLQLDYPSDKIEFIFITDGSDDSTPFKVKNCEKNNIILLHEAKRKGKTFAIKRGIKNAKGEIIIFTDANNLLDKNAVKYLTRHFVDKSIGGVSGEKYILENKGREASRGDGFFWRYESFLKLTESKCGSIMGGDGEIFAVRKDLLKNLDERIINDDAAISFDIVKNGFRVIYDKDAKAREYASVTFFEDFKVKTRIVIGGIQSLVIYSHLLLNPFKAFAIQFFFHKILRWFAGILMLLLLILNLFLQNYLIFLLFLYLQLLFYLFAVIGFFLSKIRVNIKIFYFPYYFCLMNFASIVGIVKFFFVDFNDEFIASVWKKAGR